MSLIVMGSHSVIDLMETFMKLRNPVSVGGQKGFQQ